MIVCRIVVGCSRTYLWNTCGIKFDKFRAIAVLNRLICLHSLRFGFTVVIAEPNAGVQESSGHGSLPGSVPAETKGAADGKGVVAVPPLQRGMSQLFQVPEKERTGFAFEVLRPSCGVGLSDQLFEAARPLELHGMAVLMRCVLRTSPTP